jgi:hypothetical protein
VREGIKEQPALSDPTPPGSRSPPGFRVVLALSIPVYLALAWIITTWLPGYSFLALVPAVFAVHSAAILLSRRKG